MQNANGKCNRLSVKPFIATALLFLGRTRAGSLAALLSAILSYCLSVCPALCISSCRSAWRFDILLTLWKTSVLITKLKSRSVFLSVCLSVYLSVCMYVCRFVFLSFWHLVDILNNFNVRNSQANADVSYHTLAKQKAGHVIALRLTEAPSSTQLN